MLKLREIVIKGFTKTKRRTLTFVSLLISFIITIILVYINISVFPNSEIPLVIVGGVIIFVILFCCSIGCIGKASDIGEISILINQEGFYIFDAKSKTPKLKISWSNFEGLRRKMTHTQKKDKLKTSIYCVIYYHDNLNNMSEYTFSLESFDKSSKRIWSKLIKALKIFLSENKHYRISDEIKIVSKVHLKGCRKKKEHGYNLGAICPKCSEISLKSLRSKGDFFQIYCPSCSEEIHIKIGTTKEIDPLNHVIPHKSGLYFIFLVCIYNVLMNTFLSFFISLEGMLVYGSIFFIIHIFLIWLFARISKNYIKTKKYVKAFIGLNYLLNIISIGFLVMPFPTSTLGILFFSISMSITIITGFTRKNYLITYVRIFNYLCKHCNTSFLIAGDEEDVFMLRKKLF